MYEMIEVGLRKYSIRCNGQLIGTFEGSSDDAEALIAKLGGKPVKVAAEKKMPVFVAVVNVRRDMQVSVRFQAPDQETAATILQEFLDDNYDSAEELSDTGDYMDESCEAEVTVQPELSGDQNAVGLNTAVREFAENWLEEQNDNEEDSDNE